MKVLYLIIRKEIQVLFRKQLVSALGLIILSLLSAALFAGITSYVYHQKTIREAQDEKRKEWLEQGEKHPHIAAHFGTFIFKPKTSLSLFDPGLDNYTGTSIYLEAHYQHEFMFRTAQDHSSMIRFGELSAALVLQILMPLLIIFLSFSAFTDERDLGTLSLLLSQGISLGLITWGKILGYFSILLALLIPFLAGMFIFFRSSVSSPEMSDITTRSILLVGFYLLYIFLFIILSVWISFQSKSNRVSLLSLLCIWILFILILPKILANLGESLYPLPSMQVYKEAIQKDIEKGLDGKTPRAERLAQLEKEYLKKYKVDSIHQLPINFEGLSMQSEEEYGDKVYKIHWQRLLKRIEAQNQLSRYASLFNPYLALRNLSMGLTATDFNAFTDFQEQVKKYRLDLIRKMNLDMTENSKYGEFFEYKAGKDLWKDVEDFQYQNMSWQEVISYNQIEFFSLWMWIFLISGLLFYSTSSLKKVQNI